MLEVAGDDPPGPLRKRQTATVTPGLLEGVQLVAVALLFPFQQIDAQRLLFNDHVGLRNIHVDEAGVFQGHPLFKLHPLGKIRNAVDPVQQIAPELLGMLFFIAFALPRFRECFGGLALFCIVHGETLRNKIWWIIKIVLCPVYFRHKP